MIPHAKAQRSLRILVYWFIGLLVYLSVGNPLHHYTNTPIFLSRFAPFATLRELILMVLL